MKKSILILSIFLTIISNSFSQNIKSMEFQNQEISDILLALAENSGSSILPDETVQGKASFYFSESNINDALEKFSSTYKLYYEKKGNTIYVSKVFVSYDKSKDLVTLKADQVTIEQILKKLSSEIEKTILFDILPQYPLSVDFKDLPVSDILSICIKKYPDYELETSDSHFYIRKAMNNSSAKSKTKNKEDFLTKNGNLYSLNLDNGRAIEVLINLFNLENKEYSNFIQSDTQIENLYFKDKDFTTMLSLILEHINADFIIKDNIYYLIDLQRHGINGKIKNTEIIHLNWIQASDLPSLLPNEISNGSNFKIDKNTNSILLTGSNEEINPIKQFITKIDIPTNGLEYKRIDIKYLNAKDVISLIPQKYLQVQPNIIPNTNSLLFTGTKENISAVEEFITNIDTKKSGIPVKLKYIKSETLIKNLPPSLAKETIIDSGYPNLLFYTGTEDNLQLFLNELKLIDKPQPQIKYQLLVIQYTKNQSKSIEPSYKILPTDNEANFLFNGDLSNIMGLSFDIISTFGYQFAANLNAQISDNTANVFTDTTLTGISGQDIKFQNTDTYRYIEYNYDSGTNSNAITGTTQQITSGLIVNLNGWVSGDNMITMTVNATISKQNSDSGSTNSSSLKSLPSTSERVVTTQVRAMSGEPIVISGLIKEEDSNTESHTPLLGKIPLIKHLFTQNKNSKEKTEVVIYIVPHLIQEYSKSDTDSLNIERYYNSFIGK